MALQIARPLTELGLQEKASLTSGSGFRYTAPAAQQWQQEISVPSDQIGSTKP